MNIKGAGTGIYLPSTMCALSLGSCMSVFQSEILAIERCLDINLERNYQKCDIAIYSDGQAAIKALSSYVIDSKMIWECRDKLNEVDTKNKVFLIWVPGYLGIKRNEEANTLVKEGARMSLIVPKPFCGIGKCNYKKEFLEKEKAVREKLWRNLPGMDHSPEFLRIFETVRSNYTFSLPFLQNTVALGSTC